MSKWGPVWMLGLAVLWLQPPATAQIWPAGPQVNVKECGARGDGNANDTHAFRKAAAILQKAGGGRLVIPPGVYIVGQQTHAKDQFPYYRSGDIFRVKNLNGLVIEGNGATLRLAGGLRYGAFDKETGQPVTLKLPNTDPTSVAGVGIMIDVLQSQNVLIRDLELDGNLSNLVIGGEWGDTGRQIAAYGIRLDGNKNVTVENVHAHHHALDGIAIGYNQLKETDPPTPHLLINVVSEYNGRQALSWVGGRGLTAIRCKFNHTGRAGLVSSPAAGLDIEAESSVCRDGLFIECEFVNNAGCGVVADSGDGGYSRFIRCTVWGTTTWSIWARKPAMVFDDSFIYGSIVHGFGSPDAAQATQFRRCHFEDREYPEFGVFRAAAMAEISGADNLLFEDCTFIANKTRALYVDGSTTRELIRGCTIVHRDASPREFASLIRGAKIETTQFLEQYPAGAKVSTFIVADDVEVGPGLNVAGPQCAWGHPPGATGVVPPSR